MATSTTVQSNYAGKVAGKIVGAMYAEAQTLKAGVLTMITDINYKYNLRKISTTGGRRLYTCAFAPAGSITYGEKVIEPIKFKDDFEICKEDFRKTWGDGDLGASAWNDGNMKELMDAILDDKLSQEALEIETMIWQGNKSNGAEFDGFLTLFAADSDVIDVNISAVTKANVIDALEAAVSAMPLAMKNNQKTFIAVSNDVAEKYYFYLNTQGVVNGLGDDANTRLTFGGYKLVVLPGLPANTIVISHRDNLVLATGLEADFNSIRLVDSDATHLDGKIIGSMVYNGAVGYYYGDEIVWARVSTPSV